MNKMMVALGPLEDWMSISDEWIKITTADMDMDGEGGDWSSIHLNREKDSAGDAWCSSQTIKCCSMVAENYYVNQGIELLLTLWLLFFFFFTILLLTISCKSILPGRVSFLKENRSTIVFQLLEPFILWDIHTFLEETWYTYNWFRYEIPWLR